MNNDDRNLPAVIPDALPESPSDLEGWDESELVRWLLEHVPLLDQDEARTAAFRFAVGLALIRLQAEAGYGRYGKLVADIAKQAKVAPRTLGRWRQTAEEMLRGAPPAMAPAGDAEVGTGVLSDPDPSPFKGVTAGGSGHPPKQPTTPGANPGKSGKGPGLPGGSPAPLPQPQTQADYRRLASLWTGTAAETLAKSISAEQVDEVIAHAKRVRTIQISGERAGSDHQVTPMFKAGKVER